MAEPLITKCAAGLDNKTNDTPRNVVCRTSNIVDDFNREIVNIIVDTSISAQRVARELTQLFEWRSKPKMIRVDNGLALADWCKNNGVQLKFNQPNQNAYIEGFNRTYRDEVLSEYLFEDLHQVR